ncbi:MAG: histidine phosphatase family protein [Bryobacteraceae bacterium]
MTRILLIRHGSTDLLGRVLYGRMPGVHLNEQGRKQARLVGEALKARYTIDAVVSSPLERATETARLIADPQGLDVAIDNDLNELDCGIWVGKPFPELNESENWRQFNHLRSLTRAPGGESLVEVQARAWQSLEHIQAHHANGTVAAVTHGDVIRALLLLLLGIPLDHILRLEVAPTSVSEILIGPGEPLVRTMNETVFQSPPETMEGHR